MPNTVTTSDVEPSSARFHYHDGFSDPLASIRLGRILNARYKVAADVYNDPAVLDEAMDRMLQDVCGA